VKKKSCLFNLSIFANMFSFLFFLSISETFDGIGELDSKLGLNRPIVEQLHEPTQQQQQPIPTAAGNGPLFLSSIVCATSSWILCHALSQEPKQQQ
jgi:hypothetical protein